MGTAQRNLVAAFSLIALLAAGCLASGEKPAPDADDVRVDVVNIAFAPASLEIERGTTVTWIDQDEGVHHTATSGLPGDVGVPGVTEPEPPRPDGIFDGDLSETSAEFSFKFNEAGTFEYFCRVHPSMTGEVVVH